MNTIELTNDEVSLITKLVGHFEQCRISNLNVVCQKSHKPELSKETLDLLWKDHATSINILEKLSSIIR